MINRYWLGFFGFVVGAGLVWGLNGFKNPFSSSLTMASNTPKEGGSCVTIKDGVSTTGTWQGGVCKA